MCNGTQSTFSWGEGSSALGSCLVNGSDGIVFNVSAPAGKTSTLSVYAGATASAAMITATLMDGGVATVWTDHVNATGTDQENKSKLTSNLQLLVIVHASVLTVALDYVRTVTNNLKWELRFTPKSAGAVLTVNVSAPALPMPPPPPPPPPPTPVPCSTKICGAVKPMKNGKVDLSLIGTSDWAHWGLGNLPTSVNRKCQAGALIQDLKVTDGGINSYNNNGVTFSWSQGGFEEGTAAIAQVGEAMDTPDAVWSGGAAKNNPGGFVFAVDIPDVKVPTHVYIYMGVCGNIATLNTTLTGADGKLEGGYTYTMPAKTTGPYFLATITVPPAKADQTAAGKRTLTGTWEQTAANAAGAGRNIQFHSIAVDAGGPVPAGAEVACSHGKAASKAGSAILQAAVLV